MSDEAERDAQSKPVFERKRVVGIERMMERLDLAEAAMEVEAGLATARFASPQDIALAPDSAFEALADGSGLRLYNEGGRRRLVSRSNFERAVLDQHVWPIFGRSSCPMMEVVDHTAAVYRREAGVGIRRTGGVGLADGRGDIAVLFIPEQEARGLGSQISAICEAEGPTLLRATLVYFTILHYHPYCDGNGRISRTIFNFLLRRGGLPESQYLPLFDLMYRSHGGYEIALRHAEVFGNWTPLIRFMVSAFQIASIR